MYTITTEPEYKLIRARLQGFFTVAEVISLGADLQAASSSMGCKSGEHLLAVDSSECPLQSQDVVGAFQALVTDSPIKSKRLALITGGSLCRMQTRRILLRDQAMMFSDAHEAERWLLTGEDSQQAA